MRNGDYRHPIAITAPPDPAAGEADAFGQRALAPWPTVASCWASINPATGRELAMGGEKVATATHAIRMRAQPGVRITQAMRINYGTRLFNIDAAMDLEERGRELLILATEATPTS